MENELLHNVNSYEDMYKFLKKMQELRKNH